ncbi:MAG: AAA family ATPase [Bacteroidota bacterium]
MDANTISNRDLEYLIRRVQQERAVLILGPHLYLDEAGVTMETRLSEHLSELDSKESGLFTRYYPASNLYLPYRDNSAEILHWEISRFYRKQKAPGILRKLAALPFHLVLNFSPENLLKEVFIDEGFFCTSDYFAPGRRSSSLAKPTIEDPLIYNVFGSVDDAQSLVYTYDALYNYYRNVFGASTQLNPLRSLLRTTNLVIFLGFPFERRFMSMVLKHLGVTQPNNQLLAFGYPIQEENRFFWEDYARIRFYENLEYSLDEVYEAFAKEGLLRVAKQERADLYEAVSSYISEGETRKAIDLIVDQAADSEIQEEALLLSGRNIALERRYRSGIMLEEQYQTEYNRIRQSILTLAKELKETSTFSPTKPFSDTRSVEVEERTSQEQLIQRRKQEVSAEERQQILVLNTEPLSTPLGERLLHKTERAEEAEAIKDWEEALRLYEKSIGESVNYLDSWKGLERVAAELGDQEKQVIAADNVKLLEAIIQFEKNARLPIYLKRMDIVEVASYGRFSWELQARMNVLLGRNGYGKSFLLRLLVALLQNEYEITSPYFEQNDVDAFARLLVEREGESLVITRDKLVFREQFGKIPVLAISDLRFLNRATSDIGRVQGPNADLRENGALHFLQNIPYSDLIQTFLYELCFEYVNKGRTFELGIFDLMHHVIQQLTDDEFRFHSIEPRDGARFLIKVMTEGNPEPLPIQYASQGTLSVLAIFGLIYKYLRALNPEVDESKVTRCPGIVVIDEVDAHLHPTWQQKITMLLKETFPMVQFILTAHNPLVVAGCREKEAAVFRKTEQGFHIQQFDRHFIGADSTEIYWSIFETEEKDPTYLKYAAMRPFKQKYEQELNDLMRKYQLEEEERIRLNQLTEKLELHLAGFNQPPKVDQALVAAALSTEELADWDHLNRKRIPTTEDNARINELNDTLFYIGQFERVEEKQKEERRRKLKQGR